jgi:ribose transport system substrate-binding protein
LITFRMRVNRYRRLPVAVLGGALAVTLAACSSSSGTAGAAGSAEAGSASAGSGGVTMTTAQEIASAGITPSTAFCGKKPITLGIEDGFGINAWSQESMAAVRSEAAKCPNVKTIVEIGGGQLQTAISQVNSMVAQGANAVVVIPDFGQAELPAIQSAAGAGVKVVPWGAAPGGTPGTSYVTYVDWNSGYAGTLWANWMVKALGGKGNVVMTGGPAGNPVTTAQLQAVVAVFKKYPGIHLLTGDSTWAVTNWDPSQAQQVAASLLAKYPTINGVISDYGTDGWRKPARSPPPGGRWCPSPRWRPTASAASTSRSRRPRAARSSSRRFLPGTGWAVSRSARPSPPPRGCPTTSRACSTCR